MTWQNIYYKKGRESTASNKLWINRKDNFDHLKYFFVRILYEKIQVSVHYNKNCDWLDNNWCKVKSIIGIFHKI